MGLSSWPRSWLTSAAFAAMLVPFHLLQRWFVPTFAVQTYGQVFSVGLLCAWVAWARPPVPAPPFRDLRRCAADQ